MEPAVQKTPQTKTINVAICGNPNCGKTTIFNAITGLRQKVANYPGVTVEKTTGQFQVDGQSFTLIDIPGSYSLSAFSPDEYVAVQALMGALERTTSPDVIVNIIDVTNLDRALYLLFQVLEVGKPVVVGLNMMDLADKRGMEVDIAKLSHELGGIPVVPLVGSRGKGIDSLQKEIAKAATGLQKSSKQFYGQSLLQAAERLQGSRGNGWHTRAEYLRILLDQNGPGEKQFLSTAAEEDVKLLEGLRTELRKEFGSLTTAETASLTDNASAVFERTVQVRHSATRSFSERIDKFLLHPILGPIILLLIMGFIFQSIFSWAEPVMNLIDGIFGTIGEWAAGTIPPGPFQSLVVDGVIGGVGSVLIFLPQIIILFLFIALIEDSGYMPRVAFLVDRAFSWCGLSGKSFIPLLSSFACAVPGIMATRVIEDRKLRIITIMVAPLMTCSARLPVYAIMTAAFIPYAIVLGFLNTHGLVLGALYLLGLVVAVIVSLILKKTVLRAQRGTFMMEMPSYKVPTLQSVGVRVLNRAKSFVVRAGTTIFAITILIWALSYYPRSEQIASQFDSQLVANQAASAQATASYETELTSAAVDVASQEALLFAQGRFAIVETAEELPAVRKELLAIYPEQEALISLLQERRAMELNFAARDAELLNDKAGALLSNSYLGRIGRTVQPLFEPLGWDWKITMATLASFPAREVIIATLGTIYNLGSDVDEGSTSLVDKMRDAKWEDGSRAGQPVYSPAVALSIMVFFALCCQCGATVVTIRQETGAWKYAIGAFLYMTIFAYFAAIAVFQTVHGMGY